MKNSRQIRTSDPACFKKMARAYKNRENILFTDDAGTGVNPAYSTLLDMGRQAGLDSQQWLGVLLALGLAGAGIWLVRAAVLDPEPTSKLSMLAVGGVACLLCGGFSAIKILTGQIVSVRPQGLEISW